MQKLKIWQIVMLVIFYPIGIVYFLYWLYRTHIYKDNPAKPLTLLPITVLTVFSPIGAICFMIFLIRFFFFRRESVECSVGKKMADRIKIFLLIILAVMEMFFVFVGCSVILSIADSDPDASAHGNGGTFAETTTTFSQTNSDITSTTLSDLLSPVITTPSSIIDSPITTTNSPETTKTPTTTEAPTTTKNPATQAPTTTKKPSTQKPYEDNPPILPGNPETNVSKIELISVTSPVARNEMATLTIKGKPNTEYRMAVEYSSGWSTANGLGDKLSDADGYVTWTWKVGGRTKAGEHPIKITCDDAILETSFVTIE